MVQLTVLAMLLAITSAMDVFDATQGHEPRVAINCDKVPFHVDLKTGAWVADSEDRTVCDEDSKEDVKNYCKKVYPELNVSNIVESNDPVLFNNWCEPKQSECNVMKQVVPYRCLVHEYEADALMVPIHCHFDHLHDEDLCLSHDQWKVRAEQKCHSSQMKLKDFGILLSCGTDLFTGVEFVCCPKKDRNVKKVEERPPVAVDYEQPRVSGFNYAIKEFQRFMPLDSEDCDRRQFLPKQVALEDKHRSRIAAVVEEWDDAEKKYNKLKKKNPVDAEEKMKGTLEVFKETIAALEQESRVDKEKLRNERTTCINRAISNQKKNAMMAYIEAIQERVPKPERILEKVRKFIQACEHDRVHSLRHFEHVRNHNPKKADNMRVKMLQHLKELNTVVNASMSLLSYLPRVAEQFGLADVSHILLKPRLVMPNVPKEEPHNHQEIPKKLWTVENKDREPKKTLPKKVESEKLTPEKKSTMLPTDELPKIEEQPHKDIELKKPLTRDSHFKDSDESRPLTEQNEMKRIVKSHGDIRENMKGDLIIDPAHQNSVGFVTVIGLSCGALVMMIAILIALIVRRRRNVHTRVLIPTEDNEDLQHLVTMQKEGFENPTYKFFYF